MDPSRWKRIQELFHAAAELPAHSWRAHVAAAAADDPTLVDEVLALLAADAAAEAGGGTGARLDRDMAAVAGDLLADADPDAASRDFGPYHVLGLLGEGGMGVVYLAERADLKNRVALKILRDAWLSPARRERFASEQRTLAGLNHPAIARLYDAGATADGTPWFAMEYVEGLPLTDYCAARARSIPGRLTVFRAVCLAVQHAHQHAVIHRDLKPSNILVTQDGQVKLLDFGIAKPLESLDAPQDATRTALRLMTPAYAAPEQLTGGRLGVHTDIWALGVILYQLLTGRLPFDLADKAPTEAEALVRHAEPERPSALARRATGAAGEEPGGVLRTGDRATWADLDVLCLTALQKDPARRYRSVEALVRDIDHLLAGEPLEARPDTAGYRLSKFTRRHWRPLAAAGLALALLVGVSVYYTLRLVAARNAAVASSARAERIQKFMTGLFEGGDEDAGPPDSLRVITLLARGVQEAGTLANEPNVQADLFFTLGGIYQQLGDLARADSLLTLALARRSALPRPDSVDVARGLTALGLLRADESRLAEADSLARLGLGIMRRHTPPDPAGVGQAATALAQVLEVKGEYEPAITLLAETLALQARSGAAEVDRSATLTELANCHFYSGHYALADSLNRVVLELDRRLYGARHPHVAGDLINIGAIQQEGGHHVEAEALYREALDIYRTWYGTNHYETASTLTMVGRELVAQGRLAEAGEPLHEALAIRERIYGPLHPKVASTLNELGVLALNQKKLDEAADCFRRMIEIDRAAYDDRHYLIGLAYANLGSVAMERKDFPDAERQYREALRRYAQTLPDDHLYAAVARLKLGRALLLQQRYREAEAESRGGYESLMKQPDPAANWLRNARTDLVAVYTALGDTAQAGRFRREMAQASATAAAGATAAAPVAVPADSAARPDSAASARTPAR